MGVEIRKIRDFVGNASANDVPITDETKITDETIWERDGDRQPFEVVLHTFAPGASSEAKEVSHDDGMGLAICCSGSGDAVITPRKADDSGWDSPLAAVTLVPGDTMAIPRSAKYYFVAKDKIRPANQDTDHPVDKFVLLMLHTQMPKTPKAPPPLPPIADAKDLIRKISLYSYFNRNPVERCIRSRMWGREGLGKLDGAADIAKAYFQVVLYCFVPGQENPQHFHPHSVEFVLCLQGRASMIVRRLVDEKTANAGKGFNRGWEDQFDAREIEPGDTVLVPMAAQHRYIASGNEDVVLLACQTPQPIMHVLEHEVVPA